MVLDPRRYSQREALPVRAGRDSAGHPDLQKASEYPGGLVTPQISGPRPLGHPLQESQGDTQDLALLRCSQALVPLLCRPCCE